MEGRLKKLGALTEAFSAGRAQDLKRLGNNFIELAAERNDSALAALSVIAYALYKMLSKDHFVKSAQWPVISRNIRQALGSAEKSLGTGDLQAFGAAAESAVKDIEGIDFELSNYARNIYEKARIKQASTAYALGLSLMQAAELTGAGPKELQRYIGFTKIHDEQPPHMGIGARMQMLRGMLGK